MLLGAAICFQSLGRLARSGPIPIKTGRTQAQQRWRFIRWCCDDGPCGCIPTAVTASRGLRSYNGRWLTRPIFPLSAPLLPVICNQITDARLIKPWERCDARLISLPLVQAGPRMHTCSPPYLTMQQRQISCKSLSTLRTRCVLNRPADPLRQQRDSLTRPKSVSYEVLRLN